MRSLIFFIPASRRKAILISFLSAIPWSVTAQTIVLPSREQTRLSAIEQIEKQTELKVLYNTSTLRDSEPVVFKRTELPLRAVLDGIVGDSENIYRIDNGYVLIYGDAGKAAGTSPRNITGTVLLSSSGDAMEGVTVELVSKDRAGKKAITSPGGRFRIENITPGNHILKLSSSDGSMVRYHEVSVPSGSDVDVTLEISDKLFSGQSEPDGRTAELPPSKTTVYFIPVAPENAVGSFSDEPSSQYTFIPTANLGGEYMPHAAVKTNLLWLGTTTPNLAAEFALAKKWTLDVSAAYNPFQLQKGGINRFGIIQPEVRYWFCQRFEKHFVGLHGIYGRFNIGQVDFLTTTFERHRYKGWGAGAGVSYGYHLPMGKRWAWEFTVGIGYIYLEYDKFRCYECDEYLGKKDRHYFGPTKAGVSLIFMVN